MEHFDGKKLLKNYCKRLEKNKIAFLKKNSEDRNTVIKHANALISIIKKNPQDQLKLARKIWKILMINALQHISISKIVRGFGNLYEYYKKSVEFEDLLFGIDPTYRDHTMHALWVYLLGDYILNDTPYPKENINWGILISGSEETKKDQAYNCKARIEESLKEYVDSIYCIMALCHDLAYPFEKAEKVNKKVAEMTGHLGIQSFEELKYEFSTEQSLLINT